MTTYVHALDLGGDTLNWLHAGLWGAAGGFVIEGLELHTYLRVHGNWPWNAGGTGPRAGKAGYFVAESIRMLLGGIVASAAAASNQVSGSLAALAIGVAAPIVVHRLTALVAFPASTGEQRPPLVTTVTPRDPEATMPLIHGPFPPGPALKRGQA